MKILLITNMYPSIKKPFYGAFVKEQVRCLREQGNDVTVIGDKGEGNTVFQLSKKYLLIALKSMIFAILKRPDIIHAHYIFPPGFIGWVCSFLTRTPLILTSHRGDIYDMPYINDLLFNLTQFCLKKANRIVAVSNEIKNKMIEDFQIVSKKITVIDMGVGISNVDLEKCPQKIIEPEKIVKIVFVAISFERKGGYVLLDAAEEVEKRIQGKVSYEFIGEKPSGIDRIIQQKGLQEAVRFCGMLSHSQTLEKMKHAQIFVLPSSSEGLPIAMLEAMSFGLGVIITPVGDVPIVISNEENGILIPISDHKSLADAIQRFVNDEGFLEKLGKNAIKTANQYSSTKKAYELTDLYNSCLNKQISVN